MYSYYYSVVREGWKCPCCGRGVSPDVAVCPCYYENRVTVTVTTAGDSGWFCPNCGRYVTYGTFCVCSQYKPTNSDDWEDPNHYTDGA